MVLANRGYNSLFDNMFRDPFLWTQSGAHRDAGNAD